MAVHKTVALLMVGLLLLGVVATASAKKSVDESSSSGEDRVVYADMRLAVHEKKATEESSDAPISAPAPEPSASDE